MKQQEKSSEDKCCLWVPDTNVFQLTTFVSLNGAMVPGSMLEYDDDCILAM